MEQRWSSDGAAMEQRGEMMRILKRTLILATLACAPLSAQAPAAPHPALAGLHVIRLNITLDAKSTVLVPLDTARLMHGIDSGLHANGWQLAPTDTTVPVFLIHVEISEYTPLQGPPIYLIRYDYGLIERVKVRGNIVLARTWSGTTWTQIAATVHQIDPLLVRQTMRIVRDFNAARGPIRDRSA